MERLAEIRADNRQTTLVFAFLIKEIIFLSCERSVCFSASIKGLEALKRIWSEMLEWAKGYLGLKAAATARPLVLFICTFAFGGKDRTEKSGFGDKK